MKRKSFKISGELHRELKAASGLTGVSGSDLLNEAWSAWKASTRRHTSSGTADWRTGAELVAEIEGRSP